MRKNPKDYADKIDKNKEYFKGNVWKKSNAIAGIKTEEGIAINDEDIDF